MELSMFSVKTERGERGRKITGGISNVFLRDAGKRAIRKASEARRLVNRAARGAWANESRGKFVEVAFPASVSA
jgi:hypothetical protein